MSQSSRKDVASRDKNEKQHSSNMPISQQKTEITIRNKVMWQKNILPGGRIDWVIVGFDAPASVEKKVGAQIDVGETLGKENVDPEDNITATIPLELELTAKKNALRLIIGESSGKLVAEAVKKQEAITTKFVTKEIAVLEKAILGNESGATYSGESHGKYRRAEEVTVGLGREAKPIPLKYSRDRKVSEVPPTVGGIFKPSKWLRRITPVTSHNLPIGAERKSRDDERKSRDLHLRTQSNQKSKTTSRSPTAKRPLSNPQSCNASPISPPAKKLHPAEVLRSFQGSTNSSPNNFTPMYCPTFNTQSSKARLTTSIYPRINQSLTIRPKKTVSVASRMITHALGIRTIPRVREPEI
ncbi:hypothetical protein OCU04_012742 [Sclerotinia nivalis]|uniref:Uncharacterized protein n=1 Tax=Sclerotinia nivalis TaxID=352851 RepID=A0A9X0DDA3_9HELO|nr:hypothetical protein OCU04_012742 [Sclerotinia nivalis]